jgi:hypothetical protein
MPSRAELMAGGMQAQVASRLGVDTAGTATAAGTTQGTATVLTINFVNVTTSLVGAGVQMAYPFDRNFIWNTGPNTLTVYPPTGGTIMGLAQNVGVTVAAASGVALEGDGVTFFANISI